ncbi:MAG: hypothetical protein WCJ11_11425 [Methylococcaceae bacterium]
MNEVKKTGVSFECTEKQRNNYIKAAGGKKLGVWIQSVLDAAIKQQATNVKIKVKPVVTMKTGEPVIIDFPEEDAGDNRGNR